MSNKRAADVASSVANGSFRPVYQFSFFFLQIRSRPFGNSSPVRSEGSKHICWYLFFTMPHLRVPRSTGADFGQLDVPSINFNCQSSCFFRRGHRHIASKYYTEKTLICFKRCPLSSHVTMNLDRPCAYFSIARNSNFPSISLDNA